LSLTLYASCTIFELSGIEDSTTGFTDESFELVCCSIEEVGRRGMSTVLDFFSSAA
jgi:hypothetical protein